MLRKLEFLSFKCERVHHNEATKHKLNQVNECAFDVENKDVPKPQKIRLQVKYCRLYKERINPVAVGGLIYAFVDTSAGSRQT